jgi:hypothetical protein
MFRFRFVRILIVALPPFLLAVAGMSHPGSLDDTSAMHWHDMHVVLLPVFPLLGVAPWLLIRHERPTLGWIAAVLGYAYATLYSGLDVLAGIGAGALQQRNADNGVSTLFAEGNRLGAYGAWAYFAATVLVATVTALRWRWPALPGAVLVVAGAWSFLDSHIFRPRGVLTMIALGVGWVALATAQGSGVRPVSTRSTHSMSED